MLFITKTTTHIYLIIREKIVAVDHSELPKQTYQGVTLIGSIFKSYP